MVKLKMHAMYDHFPDRNPKEGERYLDCYSDLYVQNCTEPGNNIALLLEPRSMIAPAYEYVAAHPEYFKLIFTHDSKLLQLPQARYLNWADVWLTTDSVKNKHISLCTSFKDWCPLHKARLFLAKVYDYPTSGVDVFFGDWNNPEIPEVKAADYLEHYMYSIIIENDIDDLWYTEKILNCFATKTVPIYLGARKIGEHFNADGIIQVESYMDIPDVVKMLRYVSYYDKLDAVNDNYELVKAYKTPWKERFFRDYEKLMEDVLNGTEEVRDPFVHVVSAHHRGN
jgi:hypothetical protein